MPARKKTVTGKKSTAAATDKNPLNSAGATTPASEPRQKHSETKVSAANPSSQTKSEHPSHPSRAIKPTLPRAPQPDSTETPPPPPEPLIRTTYNQERVKHSIALMSAVIAVGVIALGWVFKDALMIWKSAENAAIYDRLEVSTEDINHAKLAAITQASQASTPAQATAAPNLEPVYLDPSWTKKTTAELFTELRSSQQKLNSQKIEDNKAIQHYLDVASQYQQQNNEQKARQQLLNGLQLALELQILHDYYKN